MFKKKRDSLSKRELDVMNILWGEGKPLIASEIPSRQPGLSVNTVQSVLKKLLERDFIKVAEIVQSGTVLSRSYVPNITPEEYAVTYVTSQIHSFDKIVSDSRFFISLFHDVKNDESLVEELEKFIQERKSKEGGLS